MSPCASALRSAGNSPNSRLRRSAPERSINSLGCSMRQLFQTSRPSPRIESCFVFANGRSSSVHAATEPTGQPDRHHSIAQLPRTYPVDLGSATTATRPHCPIHCTFIVRKYFRTVIESGLIPSRASTISRSLKKACNFDQSHRQLGSPAYADYQDRCRALTYRCDSLARLVALERRKPQQIWTGRSAT
jgi:hypothetical protein